MGVSLAITSFPQNTLAEIATAWDWMGLFVVGTTGNNTTNSISWSRTGDASLGLDCQHPSSSNTSPSSKPYLSGKCQFNMPSLSQPGAYEFRLNANQSDTLLALSKVVWVDFGPDSSATCPTPPASPFVILTWPALVGVDTVDIYRDPPGSYIATVPASPPSYIDSPVTAGVTYTYQIAAHASPLRGDTYQSSSSTQITPCSTSHPAWLETSGGDVHSNQ